jgi:hypothetical protein
MQMRLAGVSGIADPRQYLTAPNAVSCLHTQTARLQVHVVCELPATQVESDGVTGNRVGRYWYCWAESLVVARNIVRKIVFCC